MEPTIEEQIASVSEKIRATRKKLSDAPDAQKALLHDELSSLEDQFEKLNDRLQEV